MVGLQWSFLECGTFSREVGPVTPICLKSTISCFIFFSPLFISASLQSKTFFFFFYSVTFSILLCAVLANVTPLIFCVYHASFNFLFNLYVWKVSVSINIKNCLAAIMLYIFQDIFEKQWLFIPKYEDLLIIYDVNRVVRKLYNIYRDITCIISISA